MLARQSIRYISYFVFILSLLVLDYMLGNGLVDQFQKLVSDFSYIARDVIENEQIFEVMDPSSTSKLLIEILVFILTFFILKKSQNIRFYDRIDELLQESRANLRKTNEYLDKWQTRQAQQAKHNYFDMVHSDLSPMKLEIPVLNMAIIERRQSARNQTERGDADDSINISDTVVFSITSLIDDDEAVPNILNDKNDVDNNDQLSEDLHTLFRYSVQEDPLFA